MKFLTLRARNRQKARYGWKPHFAIIPRQIDDHIYWLEYIERKQEYSNFSGGLYNMYRPKSIQEGEKND